MAKLLIVLSSDIYVRNYLRTGVISSLRAEHSVKIIADSRLALLDEVMREDGYLGAFTVTKTIERRRRLLFAVLMWRFRKRSPTFFYRWLRTANWGVVRTGEGPLVLVGTFFRWAASLLVAPRPLVVALLGSSGIFSVSSNILSRPRRVSPEMSKLVDGQKLDLIVFPSAAFEPVIPDLIRLGKEREIPTLTLIDNWDNLTSKTVYWEKPDHIAVWGAQAKSQALEIHGFGEDRIHLLGTPRFEAYFSHRRESQIQPPYPFPYLLFVGSAMPFDEIGALRSIENALLNDHNVPQDLKVVYRPHPWQQKRRVPATFRESDFQRTVLDSQISEAYSSGVQQEATDPSFQPDLSYYPSLLSSAQAVVGPLTTMLFEAALCLRPVLALAYPDGHHFTTNRRYLVHFDGLDKTPGFWFCETKDELENFVIRLLANPAISPTDSDAHTAHYLFRDENTYDQRLLTLVQRVAKA